MLDEPLSPIAARQMIRKLVKSGNIIFTGHAEDQMKKRNVLHAEVVNVLGRGQVSPAEIENGMWRYPVLTPFLKVIVALNQLTNVIIRADQDGWRMAS